MDIHKVLEFKTADVASMVLTVLRAQGYAAVYAGKTGTPYWYIIDNASGQYLCADGNFRPLSGVVFT